MGGPYTPVVFVFTAEIVGLLVAQTRRRFFYRRAIAEQFLGVVLALLDQPGLGVLAHVLDPVPVQGPHRDATNLRQSRGGPLGLAGKFRPVLNVLEF